MEESNRLSQEDSQAKPFDASANKSKSKKREKKGSSPKKSDSQEVLLKLPGGFEYKAPSKKQRIIIASVVLSLNVLLLVAVGLYFYVPWFKEFIYNVGRN